MKIIQTEDGGGELIFSDEEVKILEKRKKLIFTPEGFIHFGNNLARILLEFASQRPEHLKKITSFTNDKYIGK